MTLPDLPPVTVLLPAWNAARTLPQTLDSLQRQTLSRFTCLVLDDGSHDDTLAAARRAVGDDPRFELLALPHRGLVETLNAGLRHLGLPMGRPAEAARHHDGPLIARIDADDIAHPTRLERQAALLASDPSLDIASCRCALFTTDGGPPGAGMVRYFDWLNDLLTPEEHHRERFVEAVLPHPSVMARAWIFEGGYRAGPGWAEDFDLWLLRLGQGARARKLPEFLMKLRDSPGRATRRDPAYSADAMLACRLHHLCRGPLSGHPRALVWGAGKEGKRWLRALAAADIEVPAVVELHPGRLGQTIHGARVIPPEALPAALAQTPGPCLVAVGSRGARPAIRQKAHDLGLVETRDYLFVT